MFSVNPAVLYCTHTRMMFNMLPSTERQMTLRFIGHSKIMGRLYETCLISHSGRLEFGLDSRFWGEICGHPVVNCVFVLIKLRSDKLLERKA